MELDVEAEPARSPSPARSLSPARSSAVGRQLLGSGRRRNPIVWSVRRRGPPGYIGCFLDNGNGVRDLPWFKGRH